MSKPPKKIVSDTLGVLPQGVEAARANARFHGLSVEFKPDKTSCEQDGTPNFYTANFDSERSRNRYAAHCGYVDRSAKLGSGAMLSADSLEAAKRLVERTYGCKR